MYAVREVWNGGKQKRYTEHMHRVVIERVTGKAFDKSNVVDHIDGNGLNNVRSNLRVGTQSQNMANLRLRSDNKSGYRGIWWDAQRNRYQVYVSAYGKKYRVTRCKTLEEALEKRDQLGRQLFGDFYKFE